ncbi:MAG TPA: cytochrome c3 family protein [Fimbriimonadaceae bacterium]|nr:cytochrome c3 family protein [Fimbriimonadaceae bacterium]
MAQLFTPSTNNRLKTLLGVLSLGPLVVGYAIAGFSRSGANTKVEVPRNQPVPFSHRHHAWELGIDCRYCHQGVEKSGFSNIPPTETCMSCHSQVWTNSPMLEPIRESYQTGTPIQWTTVNRLPSFVYFNHSIHVARGVNCDVCHGPVQKMQITWKGNSFQMAWCLQCHRAPERYLYRDHAHPELSPRQQVFNIYTKLQGNEDISDREDRILEGKEDGSDDPKDIKEGRDMIARYGVKTQQLADCWVCHR